MLLDYRWVSSSRQLPILPICVHRPVVECHASTLHRRNLLDGDESPLCDRSDRGCRYRRRERKSRQVLNINAGRCRHGSTGQLNQRCGPHAAEVTRKGKINESKYYGHEAKIMADPNLKNTDGFRGKKEEPNMALTLGASNASSFRNMSYLRDAKSRMDNSLLRISSGKKILTAADDPGGLALSMRLNNELTLNNTIKNNVENSKSFVEMQDSALKTAGDILIEMDRLKASYNTSGAAF